MNKIILIAICIFINKPQIECGVVDTIKDGLKTAYDEVHCGFHKVKELVHHHEHDVDPCDPKPKTEASTLLEDTEAPPKPTFKPQINEEPGVNTNYGDDFRQNGNQYSEGVDGQSRGYGETGSRPAYINNNNRLYGNLEKGAAGNSKPENYGWRDGYIRQ